MSRSQRSCWQYLSRVERAVFLAVESGRSSSSSRFSRYGVLRSSLPVNVSSDITLSPCKQHFKINIHETSILNCTQTEVGAHKENDKHLSIWTIPCIMLFNIIDNVYQITSKIVIKKKERKEI